jgi:hypothetical protein
MSFKRAIETVEIVLEEEAIDEGLSLIEILQQIPGACDQYKDQNPNGIKDENPFNDKLTSNIPLPKILPREFTLQIKTNTVDRARENSFTLFELDGSVLYSECDFSDSTEYNFPIKLKNGDYQFLFKDDMEDGISRHWWYRNSAPEKIGINGEVRFLSLDGDTLHQFNPDFGQELLLNFRVGRLP